MSAGEDFITSDQLKNELNQACSNKSISSDIIKVDENSKEYKYLKSSRQGTIKKKIIIIQLYFKFCMHNIHIRWFPSKILIIVFDKLLFVYLYIYIHSNYIAFICF